MAMSRVVVLIAALGAAFGAGWVVGAAGRTDVELALQQAGLRRDAVEVRAALLDARIDLFGTDTAAARVDFQRARETAARLQRQLREMRRPEQAGRLEIAVAHLADADHLASTSVVGAQGAATDALRALDAVGIGAGAGAK